jgi:oligopeptide/dipeptide ABC transporter ATP-binding protein
MGPESSGEPGVAEPLLRVRDLSIDIAREGKAGLPVVAGASFDAPAGAIVGVFGESGSGKTTLALALPGLLGRARYRVRGSIQLRGREINGLSERELESVRGAEIGMVFQDPLLALNPVLTLRRQLSEALRAHRREEPGSVTRLLELVGLEASPRIENACAHQLSGGERQRALIALALASNPALVVADEPFSALDAPRVVELARLFREWKQQLGTAFLVIDHSPAALAHMADFALAMYAGQIVERGPAKAVFERPLHPYVRALMSCAAQTGPAAPIPGSAPGLEDRPPGCPFEPRCAGRIPRCGKENPPEYAPEPGRAARCFLYAG